ncbi:MAG: hypothetical protein M3391_08545 [Actinomycetota bacterium]|nr:hypothetical protein [Actinomycetota bacterium]
MNTVGRRGLRIFVVVVGVVSGAAAATATYFLGLEGETDMNDLFLLGAIGFVAAVIVGAMTYLITREDEPEA